MLAQFLLEQLGYGRLIGGAAGLGGGVLLGLAQRRDWMSPALAQLGVFALPLLCIIASEESGASMFIAAFVAGLAVQVGFPHAARHSVEFTEEWGQLFNSPCSSCLACLWRAPGTRSRPLCCSMPGLSLTVVRMLPVAIALAGTGMSRATVVFMGWFGPRGLASIVLGLVYLEQQTKLPGEDTIRLAVMATVLLSIVAHGLSAMPGIARYARGVKSLPPNAPELAAVEGSAESAK